MNTTKLSLSQLIEEAFLPLLTSLRLCITRYSTQAAGVLVNEVLFFYGLREKIDRQWNSHHTLQQYIWHAHQVSVQHI